MPRSLTGTAPTTQIQEDMIRAGGVLVVVRSPLYASDVFVKAGAKEVRSYHY